MIIKSKNGERWQRIHHFGSGKGQEGKLPHPIIMQAIE
jgi:hypothetical protein